MLWIVLIILVFLGGAGGVIGMLNKQFGAHDQRMRESLQTVEEEFKKKREIISELAQLSLGLISAQAFERLNGELASSEEKLRSERGRLTITEAELEAVERRLRDLEELKRELEVSSLEASRELELLRTQQRDINAENERLKNNLNQATEKIDVLLLELSGEKKVVELMTSTKAELAQIEKQCEEYASQTHLINTKYMDLKKAYDALDIEYAQLYERHQSGS
jgi:chromosome segregation ATPase